VAQLYERRAAPPELTYVWLGTDDLDAGLAFGIRSMGIEHERVGTLTVERRAVLGYESRLLIGKARMMVLGLPEVVEKDLHKRIAPTGEFPTRRIWPPEQSGGVLLP
jgi:hypothetical protein